MTTEPPTPDEARAIDADGDRPDGDGGGGIGWKIAAVVAVVAALGAMGTLGWLLLRAGDDAPSSQVRACVPNRDFTTSAPKAGASGTAGGAHPTDGTCPPKGARYVDGLVQDATATGFDLITLDGEKESFAVRPADRPYIDVQHAQSHASLGQPIRVWLERIDGEDVIVYLADPPLED